MYLSAVPVVRFICECSHKFYTYRDSPHTHTHTNLFPIRESGLQASYCSASEDEVFPTQTDESELANVLTLCASSPADPPCYRTVNTLFPDNGGKKESDNRPWPWSRSGN
jgi:hypothetical protein